jgi:hypothetical protein
MKSKNELTRLMQPTQKAARLISGEQGNMRSARENQEFETDVPPAHRSTAALAVKGK